MGNFIDEIVKKLDLLDEVLQDNCATHDWACYSIRIDEIKEKVNQLEQEIRNKAIDEFANALNNSPNIHKWACRDLTLEFCNGDDCDECENEFMEEIYQIAEQMKGGAEK